MFRVLSAVYFSLKWTTMKRHSGTIGHNDKYVCHSNWIDNHSEIFTIRQFDVLLSWCAFPCDRRRTEMNWLIHNQAFRLCIDTKSSDYILFRNFSFCWQNVSIKWSADCKRDRDIIPDLERKKNRCRDLTKAYKEKRTQRTVITEMTTHI